MFLNAYQGWMTDAVAYLTDAAQRSILFTDILRQRGNTYLEHLAADQPPVRSRVVPLIHLATPT